jgi:hypothetical protein
MIFVWVMGLAATAANPITHTKMACEAPQALRSQQLLSE